MRARSSLFRVTWPENQAFLSMAREWSESASSQILGFVWVGWDNLDRETLQRVWRQTNRVRNLEREMTQLLVPHIIKAIPKESPFFLMHECFEFESQSQTFSNAQPPQYDIAFVLYSNQRIIWPVEAKVLKTDKALSEYVDEIKDNFLTCRYAPFVAQSAMLGYLLKGTPLKFFENLSMRLQCSLHQHPDFPGREHKTSDHKRIVPKGQNCPIDFRCHHLVLEVGVGDCRGSADA